MVFVNAEPDFRRLALQLQRLVVDMWEHAYYLQYRNRKNEWLEGFWDLIDWTDVAARFDKVRRTDLGL